MLLFSFVSFRLPVRWDVPEALHGHKMPLALVIGGYGGRVWARPRRLGSQCWD
jgi:hypothetical protein